MSLITSLLGETALELTKEQIIKVLRQSELLEDEEKEKYLNDWSVATGTDLNSNDYHALYEKT